MLQLFWGVLLAAFPVLYGHAQKQPISTSNTDNLFDKYVLVDTTAKQSGFYIVMLRQDCKDMPTIPIVRQFTNQVFIIKANDKKEMQDAACIVKLAIANNFWKLSPQLEQVQSTLRKRPNKPTLFTITATNIQALLNTLSTNNNAVAVKQVFPEVQSAIIECTPNLLFNQLLAYQQLLFADVYYTPQAEVLLTGYDKQHNNINTAASLFPFANGKDVVTGIKERKMNVSDIDLQQRVLPSTLAATEVEYHATSIATMIGGAGNSFYTGRGIAPQCRFYPSSFNNVFPDSTHLLVQQKVNIQNHSYGTVKQQFYGAEAVAYDVQTFANPNLLHIFSSGNRGTETGATGLYDGLPTFANMTGNFKMAKNVITIAAMDTNMLVAPFSSAGPLYDGRIGPQLAAFGLNGTSDAAALVSGTATVLHQVYKDSNAQAVPPAALIKAILFNTADDVAAPGIDYRTGFGAINVNNAVAALLQKQYGTATVQQNDTWTHNITLPAQAANLKVTLAWTDTAAIVNNNRALVNDLDLELVEVSTGTIYKPWVLNPFPHVDSLNQLPARKKDTLNTAEQVTIALPAAGQYQLRVKATKVQTQQPQAFSIVWGWDTLNRFVFTSPRQAEDVSLEERSMLAIKWKTTPANAAATGNLSVSYDNGTNWQTVASNVLLSKQQYKWLAKDTASTARLKMDCPFGTFFSNDFIIAPFVNIKVDFVCTDSAGISWRRHPYATGYQVLALRDDTAYLKPVAVVTDTVAILKNGLLQYNVFAVKPVLSNGLPAAQSLAINIRNQAVNCFYHSLQAINNGASVELQLQLSITRGVDSVVFEKLNNNGSVQRRLSAIKVLNQQLDYAATDAEPQAGVNTYRARIVFSDGRFVYTDKAIIINTGSKQIYLYPNPVAGTDGLLNYQLKASNPGWQLQLIDVQGRLVRSQSVGFAGSIRLAGLQSGIYLYRLLNDQQVITESGKIIVKN